MARHSSFKILIAQETYNNFFATIQARARAQQWAEFGLDSDPLASFAPGNPQLPGQTARGLGGAGQRVLFRGRQARSQVGKLD